MPGNDAGTAVELLARRGRFVEALADGPREKGDLADALGVSRSTVNRAVRELEGHDLVERSSGSVRLTLSGSLLADANRRVRETIDGLVAAQSLLETLPPDAPFSADVLRGATVVDADRHAPHRPIEELDRLLGDADRVWTYATAVIPELVTTYRDRIVDGDMRTSIVVTSAVLDTLLANHRESLDETLRTDRLSLYEVDEPFPYGFAVMECEDGSRLGVTVHGDRSIDGIVRNDTDDAVEWLLERFEALRSSATPLP